MTRLSPETLDISLDASLDVPLNEQVYRSLRMMIGRRLAAGDRLPASRDLARALKVGRVTVTTAYARLKAEGFLEAKPGAGTVVAGRIIDNKAEDWAQRTEAEKPASVAREQEKAPLLAQRAAAAAGATNFHVQALEPLAVINPDFDSLPGRKWTQIVARLSKSPWLHNGYSLPGGYPAFRKVIADYVRQTRGIACEPEEVIITTGIQQGVSLCAEVLFNDGDRVAVEDPGFEPHRRALEFFGARTVSAPVDEGGVSVAALEQMRESEADWRGILVTPSHQYPLGVLMTLKRRKALLAWASRSGAWVIEDDYDSELRYGGSPYPALAALDRAGSGAGRVVYLGSFTKMINPGFNIGYLVAPSREIAQAFEGAKLLFDRHTSEVHQAILTEFIAGGHYDAHIRRLKRLYEKRRSAAVRAIGRFCSGFGRLLPSNQGTHLTFVFHDPALSDVAVSDRLRRECRIETRPLSLCYRDLPPRNGLLLGFAGFSETAIETAVRQMALAVERMRGVL